MKAVDGNLGYETQNELDASRYKRIGLTLIFGSYASFIFPNVGVVLYLILNIAGLAFYANAKQRRLWWAALAIFPVIGPLVGLRLLAWQPKTAENIDFRWRSVGNIVGALIGLWLTLPWLTELAASLYLPEGEWYPRHRLGGESLYFFIPIFLLLIPGVFLGHLNRYKFAATNELRPFLIAEGSVVAIMVIAFFVTFSVGARVQNIYEVHSENVLSGLTPGMRRHDVETLVLEANAASVRPPGDGVFSASSRSDDELYSQLQEDAEAAVHGEPADYTAAKRERRLFTPIPNTEDPSIQRFHRTHMLGAFHDVSYDLEVSYDSDDRVDWARYVEQAYYDGPGPCRVVYVGDAPTWTSPICSGPIEYGTWNTE